VTDARTQTVARGYDEIADRFAEWAAQIEDDPRRRFREELSARLRDGARVLELGCGAGGSDTAALAQRFRVTGVDISREQVRRARRNVPSAEFIQADMTELELPRESFDSVAAFYSFNHVPRDLLPALFARIGSWLRPRGPFLAAPGGGRGSDGGGASRQYCSGAGAASFSLIAGCSVDVFACSMAAYYPAVTPKKPSHDGSFSELCLTVW